MKKLLNKLISIMTRKNITVYHGSLSSEITTFRPLAHFGSREAAAMATYRHIYFGEEGGMNLYRVEVKIEPDSVIEMEDWDSPNCIGTAKGFRDHFSGDLKKEFEEIRAYNLSQNSKDDNWSEKGFKLIQDKLLDNGVKVIKYINKVEEKGEEISLCIVDQKLIKNVFKDSFTEKEKQDGKNSFLESLSNR